MIRFSIDNKLQNQPPHSEQALGLLTQIFDRWSLANRQLLEFNGLSFVVGIHPPIKPEAHKVYVTFDDIRAAQKTLFAEKNFGQLLWYKATLAAIGSDASESDWAAAKEDMRSIYKDKYAVPSGTAFIQKQKAETRIEALCQALDGPDGEAIILSYAEDVCNGRERLDSTRGRHAERRLENFLHSYEELLNKRRKGMEFYANAPLYFDVYSSKPSSNVRPFIVKLNSLIEKLDVSANDFDSIFRLSAIKNVTACVNSALFGSRSRINFLNDKSFSDAVCRILTHQFSGLAKDKDAFCHTIIPPYNHEKREYNREVEIIADKVQSRVKLRPKYNFLQLVASGEETLDKSPFRSKYTESGQDIILPSTRTQFRDALKSTVDYWAKKNGFEFSHHRALQDLLESYDTVFPDAREQEYQRPPVQAPATMQPDLAAPLIAAKDVTPPVAKLPAAKSVPSSQLTPITSVIASSIPEHALLRHALEAASIRAIFAAEMGREQERLVSSYQQAVEKGEIETLKNAAIAIFRLDTASLDEAQAKSHAQLLEAFRAHPIVLALADTPEGFNAANRAQQGIAQLQDLQQCDAGGLKAKSDYYRDSLLASQKARSEEPFRPESAAKIPPVPAKELCNAIGEFIKENEALKDGGKFQFSSRLQITDHPRHRLNLTFRNMQGETVAELVLPTYQPDIREAITVKEEVENFILSRQGFVEFHKPFTRHAFNPGWEDVLPNTTTRLDKMNGLWYIRFQYMDHNDQLQREMGFSLGIPQTDDMIHEAVRRSNFVLAYLAGQRAQQAEVTKEEASNHLRSQLPLHPGILEWHGTERQPHQYHRGNGLIPLSLPGVYLDASSPLVFVGDPNMAWKQPYCIRLRNAPVTIDGRTIRISCQLGQGRHHNHHINNLTTSRTRTREVFDTVDARFALLPPNTGWNMVSDGANGWILAEQGVPEQNLLGHHDLQRILDLAPHYRHDLTVMLRDSAPDRESGHTRYTFGVDKGYASGLRPGEPVLEKLGGGDDVTTVLARQIRVPNARLGDVNAFLAAVRARYNAYTHSCYNPYTSPQQAQDPTFRHTIFNFSQLTAPKLLEEAIKDTIRNVVRTPNQPLGPDDLQLIQQAHDMQNFSWVTYIPPQRQHHANGQNGHQGPPAPPARYDNNAIAELADISSKRKSHVERIGGGHAMPKERYRF